MVSATPEVILERHIVADDTDTLTQQTVALMCRYIREAAADEMIQRAADYIRSHYAQGSDDPSMLAWGVFWFAKHHVKFVVDEGPMIRLGEMQRGLSKYDMLTRPDVLIRMDRPQEDCDGFTMLVCALLCALQVPYGIVTIACDHQDHERWSHVFAMAFTPAPIALDASHGPGPGWMVPAQQTYRWQVWSPDAEKMNVPRPRRGMNGWVPTGLGQDSVLDTLPVDLGQEFSTIGSDINSELSNLGSDLSGSGYDLSSWFNATAQPAGPGSSPVFTVSTTSGAPSSGSSFNWNQLFSGLENTAQGITRTVLTANAANQGSAALAASLSSLVPIVLMVVAGGFLISALGKK